MILHAGFILYSDPEELSNIKQTLVSGMVNRTLAFENQLVEGVTLEDPFDWPNGTHTCKLTLELSGEEVPMGPSDLPMVVCNQPCHNEYAVLSTMVLTC